MMPDQPDKSTRSKLTWTRHRSLLQLEKLNREKAMQDKLLEAKVRLTEQQAKVDREFLQKEFEIRDRMSSSEGECEEDDEDIEEAARIQDWLETPADTITVHNRRSSSHWTKSVDQSTLVPSMAHCSTSINRPTFLLTTAEKSTDRSTPVLSTAQQTTSPTIGSTLTNRI